MNRNDECVVTFGPRGILQVDNAKITYKNFEGRGSQFNRPGDRNFAWIIPNEDMAAELSQLGWNVKVKPPKEEGSDPMLYLPVKVKFNARGPQILLQTCNAINPLDEESCGLIDEISVMCVDMDLRPYDWCVNGKEGRTAYLQGIKVVQNVDRFVMMRNQE